MKTRVFFSLAVVVLCGTPGCSPTSKEITSLQRKAVSYTHLTLPTIYSV